MITPTILLLEEDDSTRPLFKNFLIKNGYSVLATNDEEDALQRISNEQLKFNLILVDVVKKPTKEALNIGFRLRQFGEHNTPLIVIAAEYVEEMAGEIVQAGANEYVVYLDNGDELFGLLAELVKSENAKTTVEFAEN